MAEPSRGEVWLADLGFIAKVRPCLVLSVTPLGDERALITLVPHTTQPRQSRFEVNIDRPFVRRGVFDAQSLVTVPRTKLLRRLGTLSAVELKAVETAAARWLGLPPIES